MWVNNEIGTIQPVLELANLAEQKGIIFHTDAVQALGKIRIDLNKTSIHLLSASAHKIYGPKGMGLLYMRKQGKHPKHGQFIEPIVFGGSHEFGFRPSTENVPGFVGFAKALELANSDLEAESARMKALRDDFIGWVLQNIPDTALNGSATQRLCNNINMRFKYVEGESLLLALDEAGIEVSTGSACSSHSAEPSHVLMALGKETVQMQGALRITLGRQTTKEQLEIVKKKLKEVVEKLRKLSPLAGACAK
jgi:cysteine desulfurase